MGASLLPIDSLSEADIGAWRELADAAQEPNPFFDPDFVLPAAETLGARGLGLLVSREEADWIACLPVRRLRGWHRMPVAGIVGWQHPYCLLGTPLLRAGAGPGPIRELLEEAFRNGGRFLGLDLIAAEGPVNDALDLAAAELEIKPIELDRFQRAALRRREDGSYLALTPKHRRNFERLRRRLEEALDAPLSLHDRAEDPAARAEFLRLEASGWKGECGTGTAIAHSEHGDFFLEACDRLAARGKLELMAVEADGKTVAMLCNLLAGDTAFTFKIAWAEELAPFSPGVQTEILYLDHFHAHPGLHRLDSCAEPGNEMINGLWPDRREIAIRAIPRRGSSGAASSPLLKGLGRLRRTRRG